MFRSIEIKFLDLFRAPSGIAIPHVGRWFDRGQEFERAVSNTNKANDCACNNAQDVMFEDDATNEDVDYTLLGSCRRNLVYY